MLGILAAEVAAFPGVRVQAAHDDAWRLHPEALAEVAHEDPQDACDARLRDERAHLPERHMRRAERHPQPGCAQHHDRHCAARQRRQVLGMSAEGDAGIIDDPLWTGAVTSAANAPSRHPRPAHSSVSMT